MAPNKKPPESGHSEQLDTTSAIDEVYHGPIKQRAKALVVGATLWNVFPYWMATWLLQRGGLRHE